MKMPLLFLGLCLYVLGVLLQEVCQPMWALLPVIVGLVWWVVRRRLAPILFACLLSLGMLMPMSESSTVPAEQPLWKNTVREQAEARLMQLGIDAESKALTLGMLLGDKTQIDANLKQSMRLAGMSHLMAVSGLHVGVLWLILGWLYLPLLLVEERHFGRLEVSGIVLHQAALLVSLWFYISLVGFPPSAIRAGIMITLVTANLVFSGTAHGWNSLLVAAFALLLYQPTLLWSLSFQLSFLAVAGILSFSPILEDQSQPLWFRLLMLTVSAQLFTLPLVAYTFHTVPVFGWLQGLLVVPMLPVFLCLVVAGIVLPQFGLLSYPIDLCVWWIKLVAESTSNLESFLLGGHLTLYPTALEAWLAMAVIVGAVIYWRLPTFTSAGHQRDTHASGLCIR